MRIAVDARELLGARTGVGRYLSELLTAWGALPAAHAHEFLLCAPEPIELPPSPLRTTVVTAAGRGTVWEQLTLPRLLAARQADILFAPAYTGPLRGRTPMVVAIHDVSFAAHPEWFGWREGLRRRYVTRRAAERAVRVLTVSDFSKREIVKHLRIDPARIDVVYHGAMARGPAVDTPAPREPLVLYVGSIFTRRHIPEVVEGFAALAPDHPELRLALVGANRTTPRIDLDALIARSGAADRISAHSYVGEGELSALYARARAFVFLSDYEGFGLTPLEALASGIPIVVLDTEVAREIYGPAAVYLERPDPALVRAALERVLFDDAERLRLRQAAAIVLARYSWRECAQRTLQALVRKDHR